MPPDLKLEIPVDPAFAVTARLFVATAARDLGLADASVEDLRLATSELVANAIETNDPGPISLTITIEPHGLLLRATGVGVIGDDPPLSRRSLLQALFDVEQLTVDGNVEIRVTAAG